MPDGSNFQYSVWNLELISSRSPITLLLAIGSTPDLTKKHSGCHRQRKYLTTAFEMASPTAGRAFDGVLAVIVRNTTASMTGVDDVNCLNCSKAAFCAGISAFTM